MGKKQYKSGLRKKPGPGEVKIKVTLPGNKRRFIIVKREVLGYTCEQGARKPKSLYHGKHAVEKSNDPVSGTPVLKVTETGTDETIYFHERSMNTNQKENFEICEEEDQPELGDPLVPS